MAGLINTDRFLPLIKNRYSYSRRVPSDIMELDKRAPKIKVSLRTGETSKARTIRDNYERLDDELWEALRAAKYATSVQEQYSASKEIHSALGLKRMSKRELEDDELKDIVFNSSVTRPYAKAKVLRRLTQTVRVRPHPDMPLFMNISNGS